ncbi:MAG: hypothetical protein ACYC1Z_04880 [Georgenia sp.]
MASSARRLGTTTLRCVVTAAALLLGLLDRWATPMGSAVFAVPLGCAEGGYIGETLLG